MEKISWKKELYFVRYLISQFRDFSGIFLKFYDLFLILSIFTKIPLFIFEVEIYNNMKIMKWW